MHLFTLYYLLKVILIKKSLLSDLAAAESDDDSNDYDNFYKKFDFPSNICEHVKTPVRDQLLVQVFKKSGSLNIICDTRNDGGRWLLFQDNYEFRYDMKMNGQSYYAQYDHFKVFDENHSYQLEIGQYIGGNTTTDLKKHNGAAFSTRDRDNDKSEGSCAETYQAGWWYTDCGPLILNSPQAEDNETRSIVFLKMRLHLDG
ncbi:ryncolin-1-like isoform X2 [Biomphalaria glabrata]|uniref:Ryncolin-1-like isoform X2 n=1 Tax=Biomphalaria glabrata TaxID=6526 RepID=A0A9W2Z5R3_BIOGL|nr:ryncolin-1-like isoform X2 [Biomphalaria glabrata]